VTTEARSEPSPSSSNTTTTSLQHGTHKGQASLLQRHLPEKGALSEPTLTAKGCGSGEATFLFGRKGAVF